MSANPTVLVGLSLALAGLSLGIGLMTSYLKVSIVFGMLRHGFGTPQVPGTMVLMSLSLALTAMVMSPVVESMVEAASRAQIAAQPELMSTATISQAVLISRPWREFLEYHSGQGEIEALASIDRSRGAVSQESADDSPVAIPFRILVLAFVLTELKEAFAMGFVLLLPFLVIDLVIANVLVGMGMSMVSPVMISLPLKLILFVAVDGWILLAQGLILSYGARGA